MPTDPPPVPPAYYSGLDLGQLSDYSALTVLERTEAGTDAHGRKLRCYVVRHLHRWPLRTGYSDIVDDVVSLFSKPPLAGSKLVVDRTGVGVAVFEQLRRARPQANCIPVTITGGSKQTYEGGCWNVPKRELAGILQVLLGSRRLQISPALALAKVLSKELASFKVKINIATGNEAYAAWREADHDDLVLATALPCWFSERAQREFWVRV